jgi:nitrogen regulatory protein P-II 1
MSYNQIKAFIHRNRVADVVNALAGNDYQQVVIADVQGLLSALDSAEQRYSVEIGKKVVEQVKLEVFCESGDQTAEVVELIREHGKTSQAVSGWIYVTEVKDSFVITN